MKATYDQRIYDLYTKLYNTVRVAMPDDTDEDIDIALTAINSLSVSVAIQNDVSRESFLKNVAHLFDQLTALEEAEHQDLH